MTINESIWPVFLTAIKTLSSEIVAEKTLKLWKVQFLAPVFNYSSKVRPSYFYNIEVPEWLFKQNNQLFE